MKTILILCLTIIAIATAQTTTTTTWYNQTQTQFYSQGENYFFNFPYKFIPTTPGYYLELTISFVDYYDLFTIDFEATTEKYDYIEKEKGILKTIVLETETQGAQNGWVSDGLKCGTLTGSVTSKTKVGSITAALRLYNHAAQNTILSRDCGKVDGNHEPKRPTHHAGEFKIFLPVFITSFLIAIGLICLCCCCRALCRSKRCQYYKMQQQKEQYPAEAVTNEVAADFVPIEASPESSTNTPQYVVMLPVAQDENAQVQASSSYVQLVPMAYPQSQ